MKLIILPVALIAIWLASAPALAQQPSTPGPRIAPFGIYHATPPALADGGVAELLLDQHSNLMVDCAAGCAGGSQAAPDVVSTKQATPTNLGGSISTGGTYQQIISSVLAWVCVTNTSTELMRVSVTGATGTSASSGDELLNAALTAGSPGGRICVGPQTTPVTVRAPTAGDTFNAEGS